VSKMILVTDRVSLTAVGGREQLSRVLAAALSGACGGQVDTVELSDDLGTAGASIRERLAGHINGATRRNVAAIVELIGRTGVAKVLLNGSNLGRVAQGIRAAHPTVEVLTFFHNCETQFFRGLLRKRPSLRAIGVLIANFRAERLAVTHSDKLICLNRRDSRQLGHTYGREGTHILPMAMKDLLPNGLSASPPAPREPYALFVGGTFYANQYGIEWFVRYVAASSPIKILVVGKGFESWRSSLERNGNVEVVGGVESLVPWYLGASFVIAPIFDGSGMKTKVAEALMFGKRIVGTPEAFTGYEEHVAEVGVVCRTQGEFIAALRAETKSGVPAPSEQLRRIYQDNYSLEAARRRLEEIIAEPVPEARGRFA